MHWAKDPQGQTIPPERGSVAACIDCQEWVTGKGSDHNFVRDYWSHRAGYDCASQDPWYDRDNKMSDWHIGWQELVTRGQREVRITRDGIGHRADIVAANGQIVEVQNSSIAGRKVREREQFYGNMIWIWNTIEPFIEERLTVRTQIDPSLPPNFCLFHWASPWKTIGVCETPILFDLGESLIQVGKIGAEFSGWGYIVPKQQVVEWINDGAPEKPIDPRIALEEQRAAERRRVRAEEEAERQRAHLEHLKRRDEHAAARLLADEERAAQRRLHIAKELEDRNSSATCDFDRQVRDFLRWQEGEAERRRRAVEDRRLREERERLWFEAQRTVHLDWSDGSTHSNRGKSAPCVHCGQSTMLLNDHGRPAHKVCVQYAIYTGVVRDEAVLS